MRERIPWVAQGRNLDYIASSFGNQRRCWEPEWTNQTALLYQIDRGNIGIQSALLLTLSGVCLIIIVGYLIKSLRRCALSRFDFFESLRAILHQPRAASPNTSPHLIGATQEAIYKTDMESGPQRLKDGGDSRLTAALFRAPSAPKQTVVEEK